MRFFTVVAVQRRSHAVERLVQFREQAAVFIAPQSAETAAQIAQAAQFAVSALIALHYAGTDREKSQSFIVKAYDTHE